MGCIHDLQVCVLCLSEINSCTLDKLKEEEIEDGKKKTGNYFREVWGRNDLQLGSIYSSTPSCLTEA